MFVGPKTGFISVCYLYLLLDPPLCGHCPDVPVASAAEIPCPNVPIASATEILRIFICPLAQAAWPNLEASVSGDSSHTKPSFSFSSSSSL